MGIYWLVLAGLGLMSLKRASKASDLFLGGRRATWPMVGLALFASTISTTTLVGVAGSAGAHGIAVYNYEWPAAVMLCAFCAFVLPVVLKSGIFTVPEYFEQRYGRFARTYAAGLSIFLSVFVDNAGALFAGGVLFQILWPHLVLWQVCLILSGLAGLFLALGGLRIVMLTETVQGVVLLICCAVLAGYVVLAAGGPEAALSRLDPARLHLIRPANDADMPWTGLLTGVPLIGFYFWCTNQTMVQRVMAARSLDDGRAGSLLAGGLKLLNLGLIVLPAMIAVTLLTRPQDTPDGLFAWMIFTLLPHGMLGLLLAAMVVSLLSGLAANYNAAATLISMDFVRRFRPDLSEAALVRLGRGVILMVMVISALWAPQVANFKDTLWQYIQSMLCYFVPPVACLFIGGLLFQKANAQGAMVALIAGTVASLGLFVGVEILHLVHLHFLVAAGVIFGIAVLGLVTGSLMKKAGEATAPVLTGFSRAVWAEETRALKLWPWWANYRLWSLGLLAATALIVRCFA